MRYRYYFCDVFTDTRFGGNQLAVLPEAQGLTSEQMQRIAREFNFSETTFVLSAEAGHTRRVRIFTPTQEVPFAGHPNIGTAFVLASSGELGEIGDGTTVTFEEDAGLVEVVIATTSGRTTCELKAPQGLSLGRTVPVDLLANALSLRPDDVIGTVHEPVMASVGLPFVVAELRNREALERARPITEGFERLVAEGVEPSDTHVYVRSGDAADLRARMFSPLDGIPEDPATGSANCAVAALLTHLDPAVSGTFSWRIAQGVEMGRPSLLQARTEKRDGEVVGVWIGGESVLVSEGTIEAG
jgi:trans-2,3-dihydro-3-hydroxyanthranilate isomerase